MDFQHENGSKTLLQFQLKRNALGKSLPLQAFAKGRAGFPQPCLDVCWMHWVLESAEQKDSAWWALHQRGPGLMPDWWTWVDVWAPAPGALAFLLLCRVSPSELRTFKLSQIIEKKPHCFPQIGNLTYSVLTGTGVLSKAALLYCIALLSADFSFRTPAFRLHSSTRICKEVYKDKEGVNSGSRWEATQPQRD